MFRDHSSRVLGIGFCFFLRPSVRHRFTPAASEMRTSCQSSSVGLFQGGLCLNRGMALPGTFRPLGLVGPVVLTVWTSESESVRYDLFIYFISFNVIQPMWLCRQIQTHKIADMSERRKQANKQKKTKQHTANAQSESVQQS
jgi:hypothetical protein